MAKCPWCEVETDILVPIRVVVKKHRYEEFKDEYICPECWTSAIDEWAGEDDEKPPCLGEFDPQDPVCTQCEHGEECQEITKEREKEEKKKNG